MANIGIFPVGGTATYWPLAAHETGGGKVPLAQSVLGTVKEQDIVPSFKQSIEGVASVTDSPPTAEAGWRDFSGSFGLYKQSDAPGDLTRFYLCDADNTRPGQLTAWLQWPGGATVTVDKNTAGTPKWPFQVQSLVNDPVGWGFTAYDGTAVYGYWRWNGTKFAYQRAVQTTPVLQTLNRVPSGTNIYLNGVFPHPTVVPTSVAAAANPNLWMPVGAAGCTDISVAAAAGVGVANAIQTFAYFDILFVVASTNGQLTITPYRPNTPAAGNVLQSVSYAGLVAATGTISGETTCLGAVACEGAVYLVTERSLYALQWNDNNNTILTTKLIELPRFTSPPCVWNGEVYIGADNRIVHIVPGQRGYDWRTPDAIGVMPTPFSASIFGLTATPDALFAQGIDATGATLSQGWALMRMDPNGAWTAAYVSNSAAGLYKLPSGPMIPVVDGTNPLGLAFLNINTGTNFLESATVLPFPQAGRNPRTLATTQRPQRAGPFRGVTPWYDLASETAQKQLERFRDAVLGVSATCPIRVYYQTDFADEAGADTFSAGCAKGTGAWHKCGYFTASGSGYSGTTDSSGNGAIWFEFDNATSYADSIGALPLYPTYKRVRWCFEINGDTTGATVPTLLSHAFHRLEYVTKAFQRVYTLRLVVGELQGVAQTPGSTAVTLTAPADLKAALALLKGYDGGKTKLTEVDVWGDSKTVVMTKFESALTAMRSDGQPAGYTVTVTLMDVPLTGQN